MDINSEVQFCAGNHDGQDACAGDSGGPLLDQDPVSKKWTIIGTVYGSGYDCRTNRTNGKGKWNKVTAYLDWIKATIAGDNTCAGSGRPE